MFNDKSEDIGLWFRARLISPVPWDLAHPVDYPFDASHKFEAHKHKFVAYRYKVWDIQNSLHATSYLQLTSSLNGVTTLIGGRADFLITRDDKTKADYLDQILCVIEIQSKASVDICELQMLSYLLILMNTKHLRWLIGFLIFDDGRCRAFKASRDVDGNCVYEMNERFHVHHIADVFHSIVTDIERWYAEVRLI
jgi:hypothetical protein